MLCYVMLFSFDDTYKSADFLSISTHTQHHDANYLLVLAELFQARVISLLIDFVLFQSYLLLLLLLFLLLAVFFLLSINFFFFSNFSLTLSVFVCYSAAVLSCRHLSSLSLSLSSMVFCKKKNTTTSFFFTSSTSSMYLLLLLAGVLFRMNSNTKHTTVLFGVQSSKYRASSNSSSQNVPVSSLQKEALYVYG